MGYDVQPFHIYEYRTCKTPVTLKAIPSKIVIPRLHKSIQSTAKRTCNNGELDAVNINNG
jgi:hypothetical protein